MEADWNTPTMNKSSSLTRDSFFWRQLPSGPSQRYWVSDGSTDAAIEDQKRVGRARFSVSGLFKARADYADRAERSSLSTSEWLA
jgi:hypothetical protein